jgi:hypothetical protein
LNSLLVIPHSTSVLIGERTELNMQCTSGRAGFHLVFIWAMQWQHHYWHKLSLPR